MVTTPLNGPEFVSPRTVAELLDVNKRTVLNMARDGRLKSIRLGAVIRIPAFEVERLREEARKTAP